MKKQNHIYGINQIIYRGKFSDAEYDDIRIIIKEEINYI